MNPKGRAYLATWTVPCFQFHTHQSLQHSKASHFFQTVAELHLSVHHLSPSKPCPFAQIKTDVSVHGKIVTAQRYHYRNRGFKRCSSHAAHPRTPTPRHIQRPFCTAILPHEHTAEDGRFPAGYCYYHTCALLRVLPKWSVLTPAFLTSIIHRHNMGIQARQELVHLNAVVGSSATGIVSAVQAKCHL